MTYALGTNQLALLATVFAEDNPMVRPENGPRKVRDTGFLWAGNVTGDSGSY